MHVRHRPQLRSTRRRLLSAVLAVWISGASAAWGEAPATPTTQPAFPALERLNAECQALHQRLQGSVLRVQMPTPLWLADAAKSNPVDRYGSKLNPDVRRMLENRQQRAQVGRAGEEANTPQAPAPQAGNDVPVQSNQAPAAPTLIVPVPGARSGNENFIPNTANGYATQSGNRAEPATQPAAAVQIQIGPAVQQQVVPAGPGNNYAMVPLGQEGGIVLNNDVQSRAQALRGNTLYNGAPQDPAVFAPNSVGLVLDDRGHVLVPVFVEREAVGDKPVRLAGPDGQTMDAVFVGSDRQTDLTVLRLEKPPTRTTPTTTPAARPPVRLSKDRLNDGTLVLMVNPTDGAGRLAVWNGGAREFGLVVTIDGQVAGIARFGQFLSAPACRLIADQIIRHGSVRRATLGVIITQIDAADPVRRQFPDLGDRMAVRVDQIIKNSVADQAGMQLGDVILSLGGEPVFDIPSVAAAIAARSGPTEVRVLRDGKPLTLTVRLVQQ